MDRRKKGDQPFESKDPNLTKLHHGDHPQGPGKRKTSAMVNQAKVTIDAIQETEGVSADDKKTDLLEVLAHLQSRIKLVEAEIEQGDD